MRSSQGRFYVVACCHLDRIILEGKGLDTHLGDDHRITLEVMGDAMKLLPWDVFLEERGANLRDGPVFAVVGDLLAHFGFAIWHREPPDLNSARRRRQLDLGEVS